MKYYTIAPSERLAPFVRIFWVYEGDASDAEPYIYRGYADACAELVFHYRCPFEVLNPNGERAASHAAGLHAQTRNVTRWIASDRWAIFGCYLYPFAIPVLLGYPASDVTDELIDLRSLAGIEGSELEERIMTASTTQERVAILSAFLERRLDRNSRPASPIFGAIGHIIQVRGLVDVKSLSRSAELSHRQFERKFKEFAGFSPKTYTRIARFQAAVKQFGTEKTLTDIAYDAGYYDQSHFIADFKEFSGYSPKAFFKGSAEGSEYLSA